ncbi:MAG: uroporphyrinogen-III C-methyltransferase [Wenzhouxiangella sp.]|nr:uroporphyrinogen-III C-methyltransferase [Wenzhouxiangella sp.]MCH8476931.1 siroheme synthase CysG [Wenzhouxiangella sp.]TVR97871.1 MAG: uroporphyrinogen-III C-methyltransferase [Wenzhouxiangellaceae bacterium]
MEANTSTHQPGWFPVFLDLAERRVLVVGGGLVARRKIGRLLKARASIDLIAETLDSELAEMHVAGQVQWLGRRFASCRLEGYALIVVAEASQADCQRLRRWGERQGVPVNAVDQLEHSTAIVPAVVDRSPLVIAIGSGGQAPELARMVRSRIEQLVPPALGRLAALSGSLAGRIRSRLPELARRRRFLDWIFNGQPAAELQAGREERARSLIEDALDIGVPDRPGHVSLVGAGPGEPELLTLRALARIQTADVIVHDGLVDARILDHARRDAELIDVAKPPGKGGVGQDRIHQILIEHAGRGCRVVRLKGGDPMVFGRGGEELEVLREHGIAYEVIPGVTAASACAAYAGMPLTQRSMAQSVRLVTAHCERSIDRLDWPALAADRQTLAFYMSVARLELIQAHLIAHGRSPATPIALVENGSRPEQRVIVGELGELSHCARHHEVKSPAMLYVGEVAALARRLGWYGQPPLTAPARPFAAGPWPDDGYQPVRTKTLHHEGQEEDRKGLTAIHASM